MALYIFFVIVNDIFRSNRINAVILTRFPFDLTVGLRQVHSLSHTTKKRSKLFAKMPSPAQFAKDESSVEDKQEEHSKKRHSKDDGKAESATENSQKRTLTVAVSEKTKRSELSNAR